MKPVIEFKKYEILEYLYKKGTLNSTDGDSPVNLEVKTGLVDDLTEGVVDISITYNDKIRFLTLIMRGFFTINDTEEPEQYLAVNGTAILYPYVRSIVSVLSGLDSETPIILPTINTMQFTINEGD